MSPNCHPVMVSKSYYTFWVLLICLSRCVTGNKKTVIEKTPLLPNDINKHCTFAGALHAPLFSCSNIDILKGGIKLL